MWRVMAEMETEMVNLIKERKEVVDGIETVLIGFLDLVLVVDMTTCLVWDFLILFPFLLGNKMESTVEQLIVLRV